jgi:hypothetical protein
MKKLLFFFSVMMFSLSVLASPISDAVDAGKAKELPTGYVEAIEKSPEIVALVKEVNAGRRAEYEKIAQRNGISVEQVGKASYEKRFGK